ncbi:MAG: hypothetical protein QOJ00_2932 [Actinomycetota bacterium]|jgi:hypothetical protein
MTVVSVHLADVGFPASLGIIRHVPRAGEIGGLRNANIGIAARFTGSAMPNPIIGRVGLIGFWDNELALKQFETNHPLAGKLDDGWRVRAHPLRMHGSWPGMPADVPKQRAVSHDGPVLVLTLAHTKLTRLPAFLKTNTQAEAAVVKAPGNIFAMGIARPPRVESVSLWESTEASIDYAFSGSQPGHPEAMKVDQAKPFHHESAFIRLAIDEVAGSLGGGTPLAADAVLL